MTDKSVVAVQRQGTRRILHNPDDARQRAGERGKLRASWYWLSACVADVGAWLARQALSLWMGACHVAQRIFQIGHDLSLADEILAIYAGTTLLVSNIDWLQTHPRIIGAIVGSPRLQIAGALALLRHSPWVVNRAVLGVPRPRAVRRAAERQGFRAGPFGWIQPVVAELVKLAGCSDDFSPLVVSWLWEGERLEAGRRRVPNPLSRSRSWVPCASRSCNRATRRECLK
jgi:hypothetical protein